MVNSCVCTCAKVLQARAVDWMPSHFLAIQGEQVTSLYFVWVVWVFHEKLPGHRDDFCMVCSLLLRHWSLVFKKTWQPPSTISGGVYLLIWDCRTEKGWKHWLVSRAVVWVLLSDLGQVSALWAQLPTYKMAGGVRWEMLVCMRIIKSYLLVFQALEH